MKDSKLILAVGLTALITGALTAWAQPLMTLMFTDPSGNLEPAQGTFSGDLQVSDPPCRGGRQTVMSLALNTSVACPTTALANRRLVVYGNSPENTGTPKVKINLTGAATMGVANPGDVLGIGDVASYAINASVTPNCNADTASTTITITECQ